MKYYVNKNTQKSGEHEMHIDSCEYFPDVENRFYLGEFFSCHAAMIVARKAYDEVDGCAYCCSPCHHR